MSGSISLSLSQQFDTTGRPLNGGQLFFYQAGTTSPQSAYQDVSLTIPWPNPIVLDSAGRIPPFYLADGQIKIRLTDAAGVTQVAADNLLVVGASSGGGSAPSVDATKLMQVGFIAPYYGTGMRSGFVRVNGRSIGSGSSGSSERANADCQELFEYLWNTDATLAVSTGRGASANADWAANKNIALPDWRGRAMVGMDDMGNSAAGVLTSAYFGNSTQVLGNPGGSQSVTLTAAQIPSITSTSSSASVTLASTKYIPQTFNPMSGVPVPSTGSLASIYAPSGALDWTLNSGVIGGTLSGGIGSTSNNTGGGAHSTVPPSRTITFYMHL